MAEETNITRKQAPTKKGKKNLGTKRFRFIFWCMCLIGVLILGTSLRTMLTRRSYWEEVRQQFTKKNIVDPAVRGNIYDCKNRLLVGSVPVYRLCMDFLVKDKDSLAQAKVQAWRDSAFVADRDSIAEGLNRIFPDYTVDYFKDRLQKGFDKKKNGWCILPRHMATFIEFQACQTLPMLREAPYKGGFHGDKVMTRQKPYGSLASRTLGSLYKDSDRVAKNGIELAYDSILRGTDGVMHNTKVRNTRVDFTDKPAINGHDLMTTIDVDIQDAAEKALEAQLKNLGAEMGVVIVMEAKTGDVKAIVNLGQLENGEYCEMMNYAVSECMEPGSTFKTASIMVGLEDGRFTPNTIVETGNGVYMMHGRPMKDWGWSTRGGFGAISVKTVMEQSSNVGVSKVIDDNYGKDPQAFIDGLKREGAGIPLDLPIPGAQNPKMKTNPKDENNWWKTTLPWMSIGYESLLPPISTCAFYNGIANHGKLVKPRFVKAEMENGKIVREFPIEVLREHMCSDKTLGEIYDILENVVSAPSGTGKKARCPFRVCGKTGTAQIAAEHGAGYKSGTTRYLISFCGFFPAEDPQYTCLVCIRKYGLPASGGGHCGPVFAQVAQAVMATGINHRQPEQIKDSASVMLPTLFNGNYNETQQVLNMLHIPFNTKDSSQQAAKGQAPLFWCQSLLSNGRLNLTKTTDQKGKMPNVIGMGARDAVYALQTAGAKVRLRGAGRVKTQSIGPGIVFSKGITVDLQLE